MKTKYILCTLLVSSATVFGKILKYFNHHSNDRCPGLTSKDLFGSDLLEMTPDYDQDTRLTCEGPEVVTCDIARVNWEVIQNKENIILPNGILLLYRFSLEPVRSENSSNAIGK